MNLKLYTLPLLAVALLACNQQQQATEAVSKLDTDEQKYSYGLGMMIGASVPYKVVTGPWTVALLLTIFGGTWVNLEAIGGPFQTVADVLAQADGPLELVEIHQGVDQLLGPYSAFAIELAKPVYAHLGELVSEGQVAYDDSGSQPTWRAR